MPPKLSSWSQGTSRPITEEAIKDFQYILEEEPDNKDVNKDLQDCRVKANKAARMAKEKEENPDKSDDSKKVEKPKSSEKQFKRIAIEEDSDEEEGEDEQDEAVS